MSEHLTDEQIKERIRVRKMAQKKKKRTVFLLAIVVLVIVNVVFISKLISNRADGTGILKGEAVQSVAENTPLINTAAKEIGNKGGNKFWKWAGFNSHVSWCACFVSWCYDQNGYLDNDKGGKFAICRDGVNWFKAHNRYYSADKTPEPGDIIFFSWLQNEVVDHVGIVSAVIDDDVFTIEGNSSDRCRYKKYKVGAPVIYGYGKMNEEISETGKEQTTEDKLSAIDTYSMNNYANKNTAKVLEALKDKDAKALNKLTNGAENFEELLNYVDWSKADIEGSVSMGTGSLTPKPDEEGYMDCSERVFIKIDGKKYVLFVETLTSGRGREMEQVSAIGVTSFSHFDETDWQWNGEKDNNSCVVGEVFWKK